MINYNPKNWLGFIFSLHKSDTIRILWKEIIYIAILTAIITSLELHFFPSSSVLKNLTAVYSLLGFVISLLLVFRTNTAYDRWWEGRKLWGAVVNDSRNLSSLLASMGLTEAETQSYSRQLIAFSSSMKEHLRRNKLPKIIENIRNFIIEQGGEIHFESKLTGITRTDNKISHLEINHGEQTPIKQVILATGHSARDIFYLLHQTGIKVLAKPFALGVRVEHTQALIDQMQYHGRLNDEYLAPASYSLVEQIDGRGVYSFCMCPGGIIAPCATANGEVVTNGWSPSKRNNPYSNSGIVVSIDPTDFENPEDPFVCLTFQQEVEKLCHDATGNNQKVPAQRLLDFVEGRKSKDFPRSSYTPGIESVRLDEVLPPLVAKRLQKAFQAFDKKMPGFLTNDAVVHAPESRTSSPVLIPRDKERMHHVEIINLYPCAEGAGYAGGIVSAAIDGMKCVEAC